MNSKFNTADEFNELYFTTEIITPKQAAEYLKTMDRNRPLNLRIAQTYANEMIDGTFTLSGDAIMFDRNGHLINGQHRMRAVIIANKPVTFIVGHNGTEDMIFDNGLKRSVGDTIYMSRMGTQEATRRKYVAVMNIYCGVKDSKKYRTATIDQKAKFLMTYGEQLTKAVDISKRGKTHPYCELAGVQAALFAALVCGESEEKLSRFAEIINTGVCNGDHERAAIILRDQIIQIKIDGTQRSKDLASFAEQAISDFVVGKPRVQRYMRIVHPYIDSCEATI